MLLSNSIRKVVAQPSKHADRRDQAAIVLTTTGTLLSTSRASALAGHDANKAAVAPHPVVPASLDRRTIDISFSSSRSGDLVHSAGQVFPNSSREVVADDVSEVSEGLILTKRRSKTDQEAAGELLGIPYGSNPSTCPVRALDAWCQAARISDGPLFRPVDRHGRLGPGRLGAAAANRLVQRAAARAGLPPGRYSAHSLRAGHLGGQLGPPLRKLAPTGK